MKLISLNSETALAFGCEGSSLPLHGGEGQSIRVGNCVLKPIANEDRYSWACELLLRLDPKDYRISRPIRSKDGSFVFNGWGASKYEPGDHLRGEWGEKLQICRAFHADLKEFISSPIPPGSDNWSQAHEIAWQVEALPRKIDQRISETIEELFDHYLPMQRMESIIHSDICGNILFHKKFKPCVIDFSPTYGSTEYAEAILVADAVAWECAPLDILALLPYSEEYRQLLIRAINFRLIVTALFEPMNVNRFFEEVQEFEPITNFVLSGK